MIHHLRTMTLGEFVKGLFTLGAFIAAMYVVWIFILAAQLPEIPQ